MRTCLGRFLFTCFLFSISCFGKNIFCQQNNQNLKFNNISIKNGLSQSSPNCIYQDERGLIWIGTEDGLNKFDGYDFTVYKPKEGDPFSLTNSRILCIESDPEGNLWIGTNGGGLNLFNIKENKFYSIKSKLNKKLLNQATVISSIELFKDQLWIGTNKGLVVFNYHIKDIIDFKTNNPGLLSLQSLDITSLTSKNNDIWIGTKEGLYNYNAQNKKLNYYSNQFSNNVSFVFIDKSDSIILGTENNVSIFNNHTKIFRQLLSGIAQVKAIFEDNEGNLWIGTFGNGLFIGLAKTGTFKNYSYDHLNPYSIKNNEVLSLFIDNSGIVWVGNNGIDIYNPKKEKFVLYDYVPYSNEKLIFRNIHPIYEDDYGVLWIGSKSDGLHILDRENMTYKRLSHNSARINGLSSNKIRALKEFPKGVLWIGTEDEGIDKVVLDNNRQPVSFKNYKYNPSDNNSVNSNKIYSFYADDSGKLWIGTDNGLAIMDIEQEKFKRFLPDSSIKSSLSNSTVYAIYGDNIGNIWLATDMGVNKYDPASGGFIHYIHNEKDKNSIVHNEILCFHEDSKGNIWIGTYGKGVDKLNIQTGTFTHFLNFNEISTAVIYGILEDDLGNMWMSTNNGIIKFDVKNNDVKVFDVENGLQSNEFNGTSYFKTKNGEMFFGGQYGFNSFYPNDVKIDSIPPKIILSDLQVNNISVVPGKNSPIKENINVANEIILNHKQNNFTMYFSALHFANSERNKYKYKLEGFDKDWIEAGNKRFVSYTNLAYKTYKFRVIAANSDGVWNNNGLTVKIKVKPPIWAMFWFRLLIILIIIGGIVYYIKKRIARDESQKILIEKKFKESSLELEEARKQLQKQHDEIVIQKRELVQREKDQENLLWFNQGLGIFSDLMSKCRENSDQMSSQFVEKLVDYIDAQQGALFLYDDSEGKNYLKLAAHYALPLSRIDQKIEIGEGYVGACFKDKKFMEVDNLTENYSKLSSGLGEMYIKHIVLAPLIVNEECIGVIEIGSFKKIKGYRISFIDKLIENFSSTILTEHTNNKLKKLIDQSTMQAQELEENQERLRQNLEEMTAAQEESSRREDELITLSEESATREEMLKKEIEMLKEQIELLTGQPSEN